MASETNNATETKESKTGGEDLTTPRDEWRNKTEFMLTAIGYTVGISNLLRFPYLAFKFGGGSFILPYILMAIFIAKPIYLMEGFLGQFNSRGVVSFKSCSLVGRGVGVAMSLVTLIITIYYSTVMVYYFFYLIQTFRTVLPWTDCMAWWGADETCYVRSATLKPCKPEYTASSGSGVTLSSLRRVNCTNASKIAAKMFWERYVIGISQGIEEPGKVKLNLFICLIICWIFCWICVHNGVKSAGRVVYITATTPYVILIILLVCGLTLDGSNAGLYHYFVPNWHNIFTIELWISVMQQLFFSLGLGSGGLLTLSSYNKFHNRIDEDVKYLIIIDTATSIAGGMLIFSVLGNFSKKINVNINEIIEKGNAFSFITYPEALSKLSLPRLWTFLYFAMMLLFGIDSQFGFLQIFLAAINDLCPRTQRFKPFVSLGLCIICFCFALPCTTQGGQYFMNLMDEYAGGLSNMFIGLSEVIVIMWIYGVDNFCDDIEMMIGFRPDHSTKVSWCYIVPLVIAVRSLFSLHYLAGSFFIGFHIRPRISYHDVKYPRWAVSMGILSALLITGQIPGWAIYFMFKHQNDIRVAFAPTAFWGPQDLEKRKIVQLRIQRKPREA